jgi:hypothetical protein
MPLDTTTLENSIKSAFLDQRSNTSDPEGAAADLANKIADAMKTFVSGLTITYTAGLVDSAGAVSGTFEYTLS